MHNCHMQVSKFTDFAMRILIALASRPEACVTVRELAAAYGVSANHLSKIAAWLAQQGYLCTERGRGGGLRLAWPASGISVGEVFRQANSRDGINVSIVECFSGNDCCAISPACGLRPALRAAEEAFYATLDTYSLADITRQPHAFAALLGFVEHGP